MGGSRANENDHRRVLRQITGADGIVARQERERCLEAVQVWNEQIKTWHRVEPSPSIGVLINAGHFWVDVKCDGCRQVTSLDLRTINRHPLTRAENLTLWLRCRRCWPGDPFARILGSRAVPAETVADRYHRRAQARMAKEFPDG